MTQPSAGPTTGILIFEKLPYWGPELRRQFAGRQIHVRECRSLRDLQQASAELTVSMTIIVLDAAPADCLTWMARQFLIDCHCRFAVIASSELAELEWLIREAGAAAFVHDEIAGDRLARLCLRILQTSRAEAARVVPAGRQ